MLGSRFTKRDKRYMLKCAKNLSCIYNNIFKKQVINFNSAIKFLSKNLIDFISKSIINHFIFLYVW